MCLVRAAHSPPSFVQVFWFNWSSERGLRLDFVKLILAKHRHGLSQHIIENMCALETLPALLTNLAQCLR